MNKIKVFNFEVCNCAYGADEKDFKTSWYQNNYKNLISYEEIDATLNNFLKDKIYVDLTVSTIDAHKHNNGLANKVILVYTLVYKDIEHIES